MTTWCTKNYKAIYGGSVKLNNDKDPIVTIYSGQYGLLRGKTIYIPNDTTTNGVEYSIRNRSAAYMWGDNIFVSPKCSMSRDVIRNSGYKIKLDPEKASYIVIDDPPTPARLNYNIIAYQESTEYLFLFDANDEDGDLVNECPIETVNTIKKAVINKVKAWMGNVDYVAIYHSENLNRSVAQFLPKCTEWEEIMGGILVPGPMRTYILSDKLKIVPIVGINLENLVLWKSCDENIVEKAIAQSDWKDYPLTLSVYLNNEGLLRYTSSKHTKAILAKIGFYGYKESKTMPDIQYSSKDWALLQSWIEYKLGIGEKGGFVEPKKWDALSSDYKRFVRYKMAVAPYVPENPMMFDNFINTVENSSKGY